MIRLLKGLQMKRQLHSDLVLQEVAEEREGKDLRIEYLSLKFL
jgi:hypothetical protein